MGVINLRFDTGGADLLRRAIEFALEDLSPWTDEELESFECILEGINEAIAEQST